MYKPLIYKSGTTGQMSNLFIADLKAVYTFLTCAGGLKGIGIEDLVYNPPEK